MQDNLCVISLSWIALLEPIQTETANYFSVDINFNVKRNLHAKKHADQIYRSRYTDLSSTINFGSAYKS